MQAVNQLLKELLLQLAPVVTGVAELMALFINLPRDKQESQQFSTGFGSGLQPGHSLRLMSRCFVDLAMWMLALSCITVQSHIQCRHC